MAVFIYPLTPVSVVGGATEATAQQQLSELQDINTNTSGLTDVATATKQDQQTSSLLNIESSAQSLDSKTTVVDTSDVSVTSTVLAPDAATETTVQDIANFTSNIDNKIAAGLVTAQFDYQVITYVAAGNGEGEIETVTYKLGGSGGTVVATVTMAYDAQNRLQSVTKS